MTRGEIVRTLQAEGFDATFDTVNHAVQTGRISKVPFDGAGNRNFSKKHLRELRTYHSRPRRRAKRRRESGSLPNTV